MRSIIFAGQEFSVHSATDKRLWRAKWIKNPLLAKMEFNIYIPDSKCNMYNMYILSDSGVTSVYMNTN